jgi:hypothetical protein
MGPFLTRDSSFVRGSLTDERGVFTITNVVPNVYSPSFSSPLRRLSGIAITANRTSINLGNMVLIKTGTSFRGSGSLTNIRSTGSL